MANTLPIEIITLILSYLPVISLLRFKCVCRSWLELINSPTFIEQHMSQSKSSKSNRMLVIAASNTSFYTVDFDTPGSTCMRLRLPQALDERNLRIGGSCNGVLCFYSVAPDSDIILMNPSTRYYKVIPVIGCTHHIGLGFDHVNFDFKVVRTYQCAEMITPQTLRLVRRTMVYSSRNDSWTYCNEYRNTYLGRECGALVESHLLHWIPRGSRWIVCFNLCNETWSEVPLPHYDQENTSHHGNTAASRFYGGIDFYLKLGDLDGRLCLYTNMFGVVNVWVMKEYGVAESWFKLLGLSDSVITQNLNDPPLTYSREGGQILVLDAYYGHDAKFYWYSFRENAIKEVTTQGVPSYNGAVLCWNTLAEVIWAEQMDNQME